MIRRNSNGYGRDSRWDDYDRRQYARYDDDNTVTERIIEVQTPASSSQVSAGSKFLSNGALISICFSVIATVCGFVFKLYDNVNTLDYKQQTIFEKLDEQKQSVLELKIQIKEAELGKQKLNEHISSIEETIMELYRRKK
jgi:hypothetical protein